MKGAHLSDYVQKACINHFGRCHLKCDGTCAETRFRLSAKRVSPFKLAGASVQLTTGSQGVHISGSNAGYAMFRGSVKGTDYPLHLPVSPSLPLLCVTVCHHISTGAYLLTLCLTLHQLLHILKLQKTQKKTLMSLKQQTKEVSKWNTL